jgi:hypothetical protein
MRGRPRVLLDIRFYSDESGAYKIYVEGTRNYVHWNAVYAMYVNMPRACMR